MAPPMRPNNSRGGSVSRNRRVKGGCTFRCTGCLPTHPGWIRSKSGSVCCSANICSLITFPARMPSKPLSESISPITIKRPGRSTGPTPSRSLNRKSVRIYDSVYLGLLLFGISNLAYDGWGSLLTVTGPSILALLLLAAYIPIELRTAQPLLDLRLFKRRTYVVGNLITWVAFACLFGSTFLLPQYFQVLRGLSSFQAGLLLAPQGLASMVGTIVV